MAGAGLGDPSAWDVTLTSASLNGICQRWADTAQNDSDRQKPTVLFLHGWPESWYSWRHQLKFLRNAGYRGIAPDMRGYGGTSAPLHMADYNVYSLAADMLSLLQHLGISKVALVGHDHGANLGWKLALLHPQVFVCYLALSVPYRGRGETLPLKALRAVYGDERKPETDPDFFYILHHNLPNAASDYAQNPAAVFNVLYGDMSDSSPEPVKSNKLFVDGRSEPMWRRAPQPKKISSWISQEEINYFVNEFQRSGWNGGLNWYRVLDLDWHCTPQLSGQKLQQPIAFIAGSNDAVIAMSGGRKQVIKSLSRVCEQPVKITMLDGAGHWIQQERPTEVNTAMLAFLNEHRTKFTTQDKVQPQGPPVYSRL